MRQRTVELGGVERSYHVCVPAGHTGALPVIVALHGKGDNGRDFLAGTGLHRARAIVAAPTGAGLAWAPAPYARTTFEEDAAFVRALLDDLRSTFATGNTYLAGFSNGGGLAVHLSLTDLELAGVATVAAAVRAAPGELAAAQPLDYLNIHGTFDDVIRKLPYVRDMGFDVLYFTPIHPIRRSGGTTVRMIRLVVGLEIAWVTPATAAAA